MQVTARDGLGYQAPLDSLIQTLGGPLRPVGFQTNVRRKDLSSLSLSLYAGALAIPVRWDTPN